MHWNRLLIPSLLTVVLSVGLVSAASASGLARTPIEAGLTSTQTTPTPTPVATATATPTTTASPLRVTDPAVACASPAAHPALPVLCALWQGGQLPDDAKRAIGHVILRLVNGQLAEKPKPEPGDRLARLKAKCAEFLAKHPNEDGPRVTLCKRVIAGESIEKPARPQRDAQTEADKAARVAAARAEHLAQLQAKCTAYLAEHPTETGARVELCRRILAGDLTAIGKEKEIERRDKQQSERGRDASKRPQMLKPVAAR